MLELKGIKKDYGTTGEIVHALRGVDLCFRKNEFVSILGQSGCGKTTMLNIIGGLDTYSEGDLIINGKSTKDFRDRDWDSYRNHSVGFVFQSYNLIPHQTVLQNVEIALSLSGVKKSERRKRAKEALERVGLGDQLKKKPSEMSGGQMQRVAIARALVNNPDIILADEPTGALDTETSVQVMDILKEVARDRLVIMVTHNPELAEKYSTRIIRMLDGVVTSDSAPLTEAEKAEATTAEADKYKKKPSMSLFTSFGLSLKNLISKKGRTMLTSFAGSIGIIGIALIFAVSQGMTMYIDYVQESTLSVYPLTLEESTVDMSAMIESFMGSGKGGDHELDAVYKDPIIAELVTALSKIETGENDLASFKSHLEGELDKEDSQLKDALSGIQYTYSLTPTVYTKNADGKIIKSDMGELMGEMIGDFMMQVSGSDSSMSASDMMAASPMMNSPMAGSMYSMNTWQELLPGLEKGDPINDLIEEQYDLLYGSWPNSLDEIILVVNEHNELDDLTLYALGLLSEEEIDAIIDAAASGKELEVDTRSWSYEEICGMKFRVILPYDTYTESAGIFVDMSENESMMRMLYEDALELKVSGIVRPSEDSETAMLSGSLGHTHMLTEYIIEEAKNAPVVKAQIENPDIDVLTGLPFKSSTENMTDVEKEAEFKAYLSTLSSEAKAKVYIKIMCLKTEAQMLDAQVEGAMASMTDKDALVLQISASIAEQMGVEAEQIKGRLAEMELEELKEMLRPAIEEQVKAGIAAQVEAGFKDVPAEQIAMMLDMESASYTSEDSALYYDNVTEFSDSAYEDVLKTIGCVDINSPSTINLYASSFENKDIIVDTISAYNDSVDEGKKIAYTDFLGIMMSSITVIINAITYVLIAFVAISLIVSSIMIGVITLISVQERTKEIGILRAIGASKKNVSSMFNAETVIIGFTSGALGVIITYLLCIPINMILHAVTGIANLNAYLPPEIGVTLVAISVILTLFSGIIPSRSAAKKDPVVALRTE